MRISILCLALSLLSVTGQGNPYHSYSKTSIKQDSTAEKRLKRLELFMINYTDSAFEDITIPDKLTVEIRRYQQNALAAFEKKNSKETYSEITKNYSTLIDAFVSLKRENYTNSSSKDYYIRLEDLKSVPPKICPLYPFC